MRAIGYARESREEQLEGFGLSVQRDRIEAYCKARGWTLAGIEEDASTGRDTDRPGYKRLMRGKDSWDMLVVLRFDRIHRHVGHYLAMMSELQTWGKGFVSINESFDTDTPFGKFAALIIAGLAQMESDTISARTRPAMLAAKQKGYHAGQPPSGFFWNKPMKMFEPTPWALALERDAAEHGVAEAARLNPRPTTLTSEKRPRKRKGIPSVAVVKRILENLSLWRTGQLRPNAVTEQKRGHA